jgi:hypothetical protein
MRAVVARCMVAIFACLAGEVSAQETQPSIIRAGGLIDGTGKAVRKDVIILVRDHPQ